jgi:hypothetical protein
MYTRQEASQIRKEFWTKFGQYMRPVLDANGEKRNWLNYKTSIRDIYFRMDAEKGYATVAIELHHADAIARETCFEQFIALKKLLEKETGGTWTWQHATSDENGRTIAKISDRIERVNVFNTEYWPAIISFLKPRIMALDMFWTFAKESFE